MSELKRVLMNRDNLSSKEAEEIIKEMKQRVEEGENPEDLLYEHGLEPDYVFDLLQTPKI